VAEMAAKDREGRPKERQQGNQKQSMRNMKVE
jgi:hypothetical protein